MHCLFLISTGCQQQHAFEEELLLIDMYPVYYLGSGRGTD